ncbi:Mechanosensitive ion channel [Mesonia phycicola]|uniref:Mechanosensitive ion channel n=1 Tax=Mesonia phycicola TaxID=579105 RepID=A0A1M6CVR5_9FLAO|nr:mechanosensitive ion channel family protein [Mesonia phycicola]SHI65112.1 Mechanosensitive ion channel [Mesonia phycicola]
MHTFFKIALGFIWVLFTFSQNVFAYSTSKPVLVIQGSTLEKSTLNNTNGFPVIGKDGVELFFINSKSGDLLPAERAMIISNRIQKIDSHTFNKDSLITLNNASSTEIYYRDQIILSINNLDTLNTNKSKIELAQTYNSLISNNLELAESKYIPQNIFLKVAFVTLILIGLWLTLKLIAFLHTKTIKFIEKNKDKWLKSLTYNNYTFITPEQELSVILLLVKIVNWFLILLIVYIFFPLIFSVFEFTRGWSNYLFDLIWSSFGQIFISIWHYLPNLIKIAAIILVMKYFVRFVKYIFSEIKDEKLEISGFHPDWAIPTFTIIRFLLFAFMFILIFPLLPGSDSNIFKGVSVFLGVLLSLGSSSAIANMVAGLVITYMRPFKIGDRINIGNTTGNVVEKTLLVTRLKTIKNEEITIPNSAVLNGNTVNYSSYSKNEGLIINTTVTLGYDVPYNLVYKALLEAATRTNHIQKNPKPFVLQTSLEDFYVSYQLNAYTQEANKQALIYSELHQHIQDTCNENGIEILSPHYRAQRDGNMTTIPQDYLDKDYKAPSFQVKTTKAE